MSGSDLIATERRRQIEAEGWTPEHDAEHDSGELVDAAIAYALNGGCGTPHAVPEYWPWSASWWKPTPDPIRNLVKAGALIAAEIDRLAGRRRMQANPNMTIRTVHGSEHDLVLADCDLYACKPVGEHS